MVRSPGNVLVTIGITITWLMAIVMVLFSFTRGLGWPFVFTALILSPIGAIWIPISYRVSILHNQRYRAGKDSGLSVSVIARSGVLGILTSVVSACVVLLYACFRSGAYWGMPVIGVAILGSVLAIVYVYRGILNEVANHDVE